MHPHAHAIVPDGVFVASSDGQSARFIRQDPPQDVEVDDIVRIVRIVRIVEARLRHVLSRWRATWPADGGPDDNSDKSILPECAEVAPTEILRIPSPNEPHDRRPGLNKPLCARSPGRLDAAGSLALPGLLA